MSEIGLILALGCAAIANIGLLCQHRGAVRAPEIRFSHPLSSAAGLFRSRWWAIGFAIGCAASFGSLPSRQRWRASARQLGLQNWSGGGTRCTPAGDRNRTILPAWSRGVRRAQYREAANLVSVGCQRKLDPERTASMDSIRECQAVVAA